MEILRKLRDFLRKDSGDQNESTKLRYVIRIIMLLMVIYNMTATFVSVLHGQGRNIVSFVVFFFAFAVVFAMSYFSKTDVELVLMHISMLAWGFVMIRNYGWKAGYQQIFVVLLVINFFSGYRRYGLKIAYSFVLLLCRIGAFCIPNNQNSSALTSGTFAFVIQFVNSFFAFACISTLCYIYSRDSQKLEGKLVEYNVQLVNQANTDPLTGLNNRRKTMEYMNQLISDSKVSSICVSICDIDFFKKVNDTYGHDIGDKVLKSLAQTMVSSLDSDCFVSRWGGEEFLIVFANANGDEAFIKLQELRNKISQLNFEVKDRSFKVTLTYGLAEYDFRSDVHDFIKEADNKLYLGKENGRDQVVF